MNLICDDEDNYVKRSALLSLNRIDVTESKKQAEIFINDTDEYLRLVSGKILNEKK
ncbi:hypothetical protein SAMN05421823_1044 [Catalinimonas alkaloidigena]|uniref:HEAT repeat-containing protein n=1 Tax=Catalinimonas alkaloidigena TaxID=1075417 RepID=A0A1G9G721_9BACT|nr:hypothetical protein SAMN05421823_1044 [Catalinimonas alkaloidigena]